ncbi:stress responsive alpha/beta barrel protein [Frondihabitans sp. PhB188]|uniref:Dabb family protein n=1 Tax=Frondihabitans sp. PhB188 TaxID=2485200 RepID=UPI000F48A4A8|nr:Dabb family protein [Frondihabitans sp. PhB188]ROQ40666.1 stress responsive alpha/beta barrel protein [Frondihabitans sp. PhB188]
MDDLTVELASVGPAAFTARDYRPTRVRHVVLFRFGPEATQEQRDEVTRRFRQLRHSVRPDGAPYIVSIDAGPQSSGENAGHGFEVGFVVTFASEGDRNYYVGAPVQSDPAFFDPEHAVFKEFVGPLLETGGRGALVFDIVDDGES